MLCTNQTNALSVFVSVCVPEWGFESLRLILNPPPSIRVENVSQRQFTTQSVWHQQRHKPLQKLHISYNQPHSTVSSRVFKTRSYTRYLPAKLFITDLCSILIYWVYFLAFKLMIFWKIWKLLGFCFGKFIIFLFQIKLNWWLFWLFKQNIIILELNFITNKKTEF